MNSASEECKSETFWLAPMLLKAFCHGRLAKNSLGASPSCQSIAKASGCPSVADSRGSPEPMMGSRSFSRQL